MADGYATNGTKLHYRLTLFGALTLTEIRQKASERTKIVSVPDALLGNFHRKNEDLWIDNPWYGVC